MKENYRNAEEWSGDLFGEMITGGRLGLFRNISFMITKITAASTLVLLRRRFGVYFITWGTLYWCALTNGILLLLSKGTSATVMTVYWFLMVLAFLWHILEARRSLRNSVPGKARHSLDWGSSLLWMPFVHLVFKANLQDTFLGRMTEYAFQKWVEPLFLIVSGLILTVFGFYGFGGLLIFSGVSILKIAFIIERNYYEMKQRSIDAGEYSQVVNGAQESPRPRSNRVVTRVTGRNPYQD